MTNLDYSDCFDVRCAIESSSERFIADCLTDEMEGELIFAYGDDRADCIAILDAMNEIDLVHSQNEYLDDCGFEGDWYEIDPAHQALVDKGGFRLFDVLKVVRAKHGVSFDSFGLDAIGRPMYHELNEAWKAAQVAA